MDKRTDAEGVNFPDGFLDLLKLVIKEQPLSNYFCKTDGELWDRWLRIVFLGGKRSDAEVSYVLVNMKSITDVEHVLKTNGEDLQIEMSKLLSRGIAAEKDEYLNEMLKEMQNEAFRIVASVKGSARYFQKNKVSKKWLDDKTATKDKTWELIEELVEDGDVSNIKRSEER